MVLLLLLSNLIVLLISTVLSVRRFPPRWPGQCECIPQRHNVSRLCLLCCQAVQGIAIAEISVINGIINITDTHSLHPGPPAWAPVASV